MIDPMQNLSPAHGNPKTMYGENSKFLKGEHKTLGENKTENGEWVH